MSAYPLTPDIAVDSWDVALVPKADIVFLYLASLPAEMEAILDPGAEHRMDRRLAAILVADVVNYSHLVEVDEAGTLAALKARRTEILEPLVTRHKGRIVKLM